MDTLRIEHFDARNKPVDIEKRAAAPLEKRLTRPIDERKCGYRCRQWCGNRPVLKRIPPTVTRSLPGFFTGDYSASRDSIARGLTRFLAIMREIEEGRAWDKNRAKTWPEYFETVSGSDGSNLIPVSYTRVENELRKHFG